MMKDDLVEESKGSFCIDHELLLDYASSKKRGDISLNLDIEKHLLHCEKCFHEFNEIQKDIIYISKETVGKKLPEFHVSNGLISNLKNFSFCFPGPAFRSNTRSIIHSAVIPLQQDYVIVELSSSETDMKLQIEKGVKNKNKIGISLYINERLSDKRYLHDRISWDIKSLVPGLYRLSLEEKTVLKFDVQE